MTRFERPKYGNMAQATAVHRATTPTATLYPHQSGRRGPPSVNLTVSGAFSPLIT
jgi:hypothetical protein